MYNTAIYWRTWIVVGIIIFVINLVINNIALELTLILSLLSAATGAAASTLLIETFLFKQLIWSKRPHWFHPWLSPAPYLGGEWEGELKSSFEIASGESLEKATPIQCYMQISHEFDQIKVQFRTGKSYSSSFISGIIIDSADRKFLCYTYKNDNEMDNDNNPGHEGTVKLRIEKEDGEYYLEGYYFTGRKTFGTMKLKRTKS